MKIKNYYYFFFFFFFWGGGRVRGVGLGGQGRCEQRSEVFVKNKKKMWEGGSGRGGGGLVGAGGWMGVRVNVNEEWKFL